MITRKEIYLLVGLLVNAMVFHALWTTKGNVDKADQVKVDVQKEIQQGQADLAAKLDALEKARQITQPAQIVQQLPQIVPLPQPIYMQAPQPAPATAVPNALPDAPKPQTDGSLIIPKDSVQAFWQHEVDCKADSLKLDECQKSVPLLKNQIVADEKAMKGGSFWSRLKGNAKWFAVGGAIGAGAVAVVHK